MSVHNPWRKKAIHKGSLVRGITVCGRLDDGYLLSVVDWSMVTCGACLRAKPGTEPAALDGGTRPDGEGRKI